MTQLAHFGVLIVPSIFEALLLTLLAGWREGPVDPRLRNWLDEGRKGGERWKTHT
jgi:hypothetical protein